MSEGGGPASGGQSTDVVVAVAVSESVKIGGWEESGRENQNRPSWQKRAAAATS